MQQLVNDYQWLLKIAYNRRYKTPGTDKELELFFWIFKFAICK
jgi:hypothetical protein